MKNVLLLYLWLWLHFLPPAFAQDLPLGTWARGDGNARVRIEKCGAAICAINTWIKDTSGGENVGRPSRDVRHACRG